jgi:DNA-binding response OmpR family regulator
MGDMGKERDRLEFECIKRNFRAPEKAGGETTAYFKGNLSREDDIDMSSEGTLLLVDDEELARTILAARLAPFGYRVVFAENGDEAIRLAAENPPDCILLDLMMPGKDGYQVAEEMRSLEATQSVPIIMLTARTETESKVRGFELAINDYVTKPCNFEELNARIQLQIKLKKAEQALLEREKQSALIDLVDGLADTLLNRLNLSMVQIQLIQHQMGDRLPEEGGKGLQTLRDSIWKAVEVVNELMRHTKKASNVSSQAIKLSKIFESLPEDFPELEFVVNTEESPASVSVSRMLKRVFHALSKNALEAMQGRVDPPVLEIKAVMRNNGQNIRLVFRDRGCGIESRDLPKIFTPFFTTKGTSNPGLGLWTVYQAMKDLGGQVDVSSEPDQGTEVMLDFPISRDESHSQPVEDEAGVHAA